MPQVSIILELKTKLGKIIFLRYTCNESKKIVAKSVIFFNNMNIFSLWNETYISRTIHREFISFWLLVDEP
jgi:hypothetical protein